MTDAHTVVPLPCKEQKSDFYKTEQKNLSIFGGTPQLLKSSCHFMAIKKKKKKRKFFLLSCLDE